MITLGGEGAWVLALHRRHSIALDINEKLLGDDPRFIAIPYEHYSWEGPWYARLVHTMHTHLFARPDGTYWPEGKGTPLRRRRMPWRER